MLICGAVAILALPAQAGSDPAVVAADEARVAAIDRARPAVVAIFNADGQGGGSGVVVSPDGYVVTNFHVTQDAGLVMQCGLPDGEIYQGVLVGIDPTGDLAVVKLLPREGDEAQPFPAASWGDSLAMRPGDAVFALGNPFLLSWDFQPTATYGVISGVGRYQYPSKTLLEYADCLQIDASINPGNSGGPLFDAEGRLIGINGRASFEKRGRVNVGLAYAISGHQVRNFFGVLMSGRIVDHASLGATVGADSDGRVVINDLLEDSDAARRGLRFGDEVLSFAGRPVDSVNAFKNVLGTLPAGWRVPIVIRRGDEKREVLVRLRALHREGELAELLSPRAPAPKLDEPKEGPNLPMGPLEPPGEQHGLPAPLRRLIEADPKQHVPEAAKPYYQAKSGFANYYFNQQATQRVWQALAARVPDPRIQGGWRLKGVVENGAAVEFQVDDTAVEARLPAGASRLDPRGELTTSNDPPGSGGLLAALCLWRRLLAVDPRQRLGVTYFGTAPLPAMARPAEVLEGVESGVAWRAYADPATGDLRMLEMFADDDVDPCEIWFDDYREAAGCFLPHRLRIVHGDHLFGVVAVQAWELTEAQP